MLNFYMKIFSLLSIAVLIFFTACTDLQLEVSYSGSTPDCVAGKVKAYGCGNMWNISENGVSKKEADSEILLDSGADYIGYDKNYSVCYRISYFDSLLTVFSLGYYSPFDIEYVRTKEFQRKLLKTLNDGEVK